jgi:Cys-rich protein (TIGR01571 family)
MHSAQQPLLSGDAESGFASPPRPFSSSEAQSSSSYSPFGAHSPPPTPGSFSFPQPPAAHAAVARRWRGGLLACCGATLVCLALFALAADACTPGRCSDTDCQACCLSTLLPCYAWAHNQQRAFDTPLVPQLLLYFLLVYTSRAAALSTWSACQLVPQASHSVGCHLASALTGALWWALASAFALYAAWRRASLRRRFAIAARCGTFGDVAAWLCCPACALCQETRTLRHNQVTAGLWLGPKPMGAAAEDTMQPGGPGVYAPPESPEMMLRAADGPQLASK